MKITIDDIGGAVTKDDGTISVGAISKGKIHTIEFTKNAQEKLLLPLLASSRDPLAPTSRRLRPRGLSRFQIDDGVGISFLLAPEIGIHLLLPRQLSSHLQNLLETFDDPSTWNVNKPH